MIVQLVAGKPIAEQLVSSASETTAHDIPAIIMSMESVNRRVNQYKCITQVYPLIHFASIRGSDATKWMTYVLSSRLIEY